MKPESKFDELVRRPAQRPVRTIGAVHSCSDMPPAGSSFPANISVIVLTLNEEANVGRALQSVAGSCDVVVVDSGSTDRTVEIARATGARVFHHPFVTSALQRQWALEEVSYANPWLFVLDADEVVPACLGAELSDPSRLAGVDTAAARTRVVFEGRWIPRSSLYPTWTVRMLRIGAAQYEQRSVNAHASSTGRVCHLTHDVVHEDLKPLCVRAKKLDRYARLEALETARLLASPLSALRSADTWRRRVKILHSVLPLRAMTKAMALMLRGGIREGVAGWHFIEDSWHQERMTARYLAELRDSVPQCADQ